LKPAFTHQQLLSGTHKNLQRLVFCPIYSVVKYRPREAAISRQLSAIQLKIKTFNFLLSLTPPQRVWVLLIPECANSRIPPTQCSASKRLSLDRELIHGCRI
jgi:hypothetical protein